MDYERIGFKLAVFDFMLLCTSFLAFIITVIVTAVFENEMLYYIQFLMIESVVIFGLILIGFVLCFLLHAAAKVLIED